MSWVRRLLIAAPAVIFVSSWPFLEDPAATSDALAAVTDAATGLILIAAGLIAADRRPSGRTGPLLVVAGYLWYVGDLFFVFPDASIVPLLSFAFRGYYDIVIAFLILSFPAGRLQTTAQRIVIAALIAAYAARSLGFLLMAVHGQVYPPNGTPNPFLLFPDAPAELLDVWVTALKAVLIALVAILAVVRWGRASTPTRRVLTPVLAGGLIWALMSAMYKMGPLARFQFDVQFPPWQDATWWSIPDYLLRGSAAPVGFLIGALLLRTARTAVVDLVSGFSDQPVRRNLQASLIKVLRDPALVVIYPDNEGWTDADGRPFTYPHPGDERVATPIESDGRTVAIILHDASLEEDPGLVGAVAAAARLAIDNERLSSALEAQLAEVRDSRVRIVEGADAERRRIERDLHDGAQQRLVAIAISLRMLGDSLGPKASPEVAHEIDAASTELHAAIEELRELARGLDPPLLREAGLGVAIEALAERMHIPVKLDLRLDERLERTVETTCYFVVAEALANVAKHADAKTVSVKLWRTSDMLFVKVQDDGRGGADPAGGSGLRGLTDRVAAIGGQLAISEAGDGGTLLEAQIPCA
ncbi:MAG: sensor histidine kinase [Chloroflexota bacterium]|nr:sensor histidine kinase [Chloroflexota bacterium]